MKLFGLAIVLSLASSTARAEPANGNDAWAQARGHLPGTPLAVVGVNVAVVRGTPLFQTLYGMMLQKVPELSMTVTMLKDGCGLDFVRDVQSLAVVMADNERGVAYVALPTLDAKGVETCMGSLAGKQGKKVVVGAADAQGIVDYASGGDHLYLAYLPGHVIAVGMEPGDKTMLAAGLSGHGLATASVAKRGLAAVNPGAPLWAVVTTEQEVVPGMRMKLGYGELGILGDRLNPEIHVVLGNPADAASFAATLNSQLDQVKGQDLGIPPEAKRILTSLTVKSKDDELVLKASVATADFLVVVKDALTK